MLPMSAVGKSSGLNFRSCVKINIEIGVGIGVGIGIEKCKVG